MLNVCAWSVIILEWSFIQVQYLEVITLYRIDLKSVQCLSGWSNFIRSVIPCREGNGVRHIHRNCTEVETGVYLITVQKLLLHQPSIFGPTTLHYLPSLGLVLSSFVMLFACLSSPARDKTRDLATYLNDSCTRILPAATEVLQSPSLSHTGLMSLNWSLGIPPKKWRHDVVLFVFDGEEEFVL